LSHTPLRHKPNRLQNYLKVHETVLEQFKKRGFVGEDSLEFIPLNKYFILQGEVGCIGGLILKVEKLIRVIEVDSSDLSIQTAWYSYNASIRNSHNVLRYDNQDEDFGFREGHSDEHHKHVFDWQTGDELDESPLWIGADNWPTLGDVLKELEDWYWENKGSLYNPDCYPVLNLR